MAANWQGQPLSNPEAFVQTLDTIINNLKK
jgi:hypothetical protein